MKETHEDQLKTPNAFFIPISEKNLCGGTGKSTTYSEAQFANAWKFDEYKTFRKSFQNLFKFNNARIVLPVKYTVVRTFRL